MGRHRAPKRERSPAGIVAVGLLVLVAAVIALVVVLTGPDEPDVDRVLSTPTASGTPTPTPSSSPSATASATPTPAARPSPTGRLSLVPGGSARVGVGQTFRYAVEIEQGLGADGAAFAKAVERTLADPRGWTGGAKWAFQRVDRAPIAFRVVLASPGTTDRLCAPLRTDGNQSCHNNGRSVINADRWRGGAGTYGRDIASYRVYLVNHEVGHAIGYKHTGCPGVGKPSPVMVQQTLGLGGCRPNPWPYPR